MSQGLRYIAHIIMAIARHWNTSIKTPTSILATISPSFQLWGGILQGILKLDYNTTM